ncbi:D-methionine-binding transport system MetQ precursor [Escherichia coli]|uniref:D-methionine-binding transport system MetQ n=1 Tax=Escherichia coli TaxID=562 RepID=A0A376VQ68_ECOLX|nr:D-methionine-binding transport system MetQ precursor [Escherichia coli]
MLLENPKNLKIVELEAPQLPRSLDDAQIALAVINTTYASQIGLTPAKDGIFVEDKDSPYVNLIVTREDNKDGREREENSSRLISLTKFTKQQTKCLTAALLKAGNF